MELKLTITKKTKSYLSSFWDSFWSYIRVYYSHSLASTGSASSAKVANTYSWGRQPWRPL